MPPEHRTRGRTPGLSRARRHRKVALRVVTVLGVLAMVFGSTASIAYKRLEDNIATIAVDGRLGERPEPVVVEGPKAPMNVLVMGSDSRAGTDIGGDSPGLSDTTILLHLSADRSRAYGVSLPRDSMVQRPECVTKDGSGTVAGGLHMFNSAYAVGGPVCTVRTVEALTRVRIDHFVVVDFNGFRAMVNAIGGVQVCVPEEVNDTTGNIHLPAGTYKVNGRQALDYVRVRHGLGAPTGDIGRMKRQQAFVSSMISQVVSAGTLANPARLYKFLGAATKSLSTDPEFADLQKLAALGSELKGIGLGNISFITVPNEPWPVDPNRLVWTSDAQDVWARIRLDRPLGPLRGDAITPDTSTPDTSTSDASTPDSRGTAPRASAPGQNPTTAAERREAAEQAGLCT